MLLPGHQAVHVPSLPRAPLPNTRVPTTAPSASAQCPDHRTCPKYSHLWRHRLPAAHRARLCLQHLPTGPSCSRKPCAPHPRAQADPNTALHESLRGAHTAHAQLPGDQAHCPLGGLTSPMAASLGLAVLRGCLGPSGSGCLTSLGPHRVLCGHRDFQNGQILGYGEDPLAVVP